MQKDPLVTCLSYLFHITFESLCYQIRKSELLSENYDHENEENDENDDDLPPTPYYEQVLHHFKVICAQLNDMGMASTLCGGTIDVCSRGILEFIDGTIQRKIEDSFIGQFEEQCLSVILGWLDLVILPFLKLFLNEEKRMSGSGSGSDVNNGGGGSGYSIELQKMKTQAEWFIYASMTRVRMNEMFDMIKHYPDSTPALIDLKHCLIRTGLHEEMVDCLKKSYVVVFL